jgi:hypothetical protein
MLADGSASSLGRPRSTFERTLGPRGIGIDGAVTVGCSAGSEPISVLGGRDDR